MKAGPPNLNCCPSCFWTDIHVDVPGGWLTDALLLAPPSRERGHNWALPTQTAARVRKDYSIQTTPFRWGRGGQGPTGHMCWRGGRGMDRPGETPTSPLPSAPPSSFLLCEMAMGSGHLRPCWGEPWQTIGEGPPSYQICPNRPLYWAEGRRRWASLSTYKGFQGLRSQRLHPIQPWW